VSQDRYQQVANSGLGGAVAKRLGLPAPPLLERHEPGRPVVSAPVALGAAHGGRLERPALDVLRSIEAHVETDVGAIGEGAELAALVFDASGIDDSVRLGALYDFFNPLLPALRRSGRVVVLAGPPDEAPNPRAATAQRAIEGFVRSVAKEIGRKGSTAQLVQVAAGAETAIESTLRFLLSARSAFVDGQVIRV
jgi:3-oxoacyl-[acyl-carrier protein] reductase